MKRVILLAEADEKMMLAGMAMVEMMASATQGDAIIAGFDAMRDASPNAGRVTEAELEAMAAAMHREDRPHDTPWDALLDHMKVPYRRLARAALAAIGVRVG
jgi:hypothetical protein